MNAILGRASPWAIAIAALTIVTAGAYWVDQRRTPVVPTIAVIPQGAGVMLWEVEHLGATEAAEKVKCHLYWNTPTSENDVAGQVSLIDRVVRNKYQGLVVAPNHPLTVLAPLRRALEAGLPVVVISSSLDLSRGGRLGYIVNDDEKMGEMAAAEIATLLHGKGLVAMAGLGRYAPGVMARARAAERFLVTRFPDIRIVNRAGFANNPARSEEFLNRALNLYPELNAVLSLTAGSTRGAYAALKARSLEKKISLVGCEQDSDLVRYVGSGEIAALVAENTYRMGYEGVQRISEALAGRPLPAKSVVPPVLITRQNVGSREISLLTSFPK